MQLSSVRDLKQELRADAGWIAARSDDRRIALGVAAGSSRDAYKIAVRARSDADLDPTLIEKIRAKSKNEVDVCVTGPIEVRPAAPAQPCRRIAIGASAGHYRCTAGTLGFFARRTADGKAGFVSNNHVIAAEDHGRDGDDVLHPGPADRGRRPNDVIAHLAGDYPRLLQEERLVDCAFATLLRTASVDPVTIGPGERLNPATVHPAEHLEVSKIGRTTGRTYGRITAFEIDDLDVDYACGMLSFNDQMEIEPLDASPFCRPGDSGSLVFTSSLHPVGLLFSCSAAGGRFNAGRAYANPIDAVLSALGVTFMS